ncbi:MAG TPA: type I restriction enzyme HsdR N-terminal domain-containing protein [bacterium]|nr:type I restriction enzyme HsdR N-terminal domain-containing protein [bacterium]
MAVSKKVSDRIVQQLKKYQPILSDAQDRDISESDTVVIIADMLADILGYNKYTEITTEFAIRGTYVDLAVKVGADVRFLIEVKAIGVALKDSHIKQALDYGANHGVEWVVLTNGAIWQIYKIHFHKPIDKSLIFQTNLLQKNVRNQQLIECFGNLSREGFTQSSMTAFYQRQQVTSKFSIAAVLTSPPMLQALKRELRHIGGNIKIQVDQLKAQLQNEVLKRETVDGEEAKQAADFLKQAAKSVAKSKTKKEAKA